MDMTSHRPNDYQQAALNILIKFDEFCSKHDIKYWLLFGTALGAVRHRGFIPWDDDVDVGLLRPDFERLMSLADGLPSPCKLERFKVTGTYVHPFPKIYDRTTTVIEDFERPFKRGVWIDVFPLDGTYENLTLRYLHMRSVQLVDRVFSLHVGRYPRRKEPSLRMLLRKILTPICRMIPIRLIDRIYSSLVLAVEPKRSSHIGCLHFACRLKHFIPKEYIIGEARKVKFCGRDFPVPANAEYYLTRLYGDYMVLPPMSERVGHRKCFVDLSSPYEEN